MKKIFFVLCIIGFVLGLGIGSLYAWTCDVDGCKTNELTDQNSKGDIDKFKTSKNVTIVVNSDEQHYAAVSSHKLGDIVYGAASNDPKIYYKEGLKEPGDVYSDEPDAVDSSEFSDWSVL